ncbi:hypothetical protein UlMin_027412 [Ulmus minor]
MSCLPRKRKVSPKGKVRSATLDTWTPKIFMYHTVMGNEKANSFWEAELSPNYDRVGIENFIRAKYEDKRWVARDGKLKSPSRGREEKAIMHWLRQVERIGHGYTSSSENSFHERKNVQPPTRKDDVPGRRINILVPPKGPEQTPPSAPAVTSSSTPISSPLAPTPPKVDYATDLFNMLSMDGSNENGSEATSADDNADWIGFQSAQDASIPEKSAPPKPVESNSKPTRTSRIKDLLKDTHLLTSSYMICLMIITIFFYFSGFKVHEKQNFELVAISMSFYQLSIFQSTLISLFTPPSIHVYNWCSQVATQSGKSLYFTNNSVSFPGLVMSPQTYKTASGSINSYNFSDNCSSNGCPLYSRPLNALSYETWNTL